MIAVGFLSTVWKCSLKNLVLDFYIDIRITISPFLAICGGNPNHVRFYSQCRTFNRECVSTNSFLDPRMKAIDGHAVGFGNRYQISLYRMKVAFLVVFVHV